MTINNGNLQKNKHKLVFNDQNFYWWVKAEFDGNQGMLEVNIATEDKAFLIQYYAIQNQGTNRYISVIGKEFPGIDRRIGNWQRFICPDFIPKFENNGISSKHIKTILDWCFDLSKTLTPVNYKA